MSEDDRLHWDRRHADNGVAPIEAPTPPPVFAALEHLLPTTGHALEVACGRGRGAVWLAARGMDVWAVDVSPVAIDLARELADRLELAHRCRFDAFDLDRGLPEGPPVDLILCHLFRDPRLDPAMVTRLAPGGVLAVASLSEVGAGPGRFRARPGELDEAFGALDTLARGEADGLAWIIARA